MNFSIKEITARLTEISLHMVVSDELLFKKLEMMDQLQSELKGDTIDIRAGYQKICIQWKSVARIEKLRKILASPKNSIPSTYKIWEVPICYAPIFGRDIQAVAQAKGLSIAEIISLHCKPRYRIHFFGFLPGFMYLSGLHSTLSFPRKSIPDRSIEKGAVAIGGSQTGIYPNESPGGWHVIGKTPLSLFNPHAREVVWAKAGDHIQFKPISLDEYKELENQHIAPRAL